MKTKKIIQISFLLALITVAVNVFASPQRGCKRHHQPGLKIEAFADELGLTEEQLSKLKEQQFSARKTAINTRSKIQVAELELAKLMQDKAADESTIKNKIKEIGELKTALRLNRIEEDLAANKVLTDEQSAKLQSLRTGPLKNRMHRGSRQFRNPEQHRNLRGHHGGVRRFDSGCCAIQDDKAPPESGSRI